MTTSRSSSSCWVRSRTQWSRRERRAAGGRPPHRSDRRHRRCRHRRLALARLRQRSAPTHAAARAEGDRKAYFEVYEKHKRANESLVKNLRSENKTLRHEIAEKRKVRTSRLAGRAVGGRAGCGGEHRPGVNGPVPAPLAPAARPAPTARAARPMHSRVSGPAALLPGPVARPGDGGRVAGGDQGEGAHDQDAEGARRRETQDHSAEAVAEQAQGARRGGAPGLVRVRGVPLRGRAQRRRGPRTQDEFQELQMEARKPTREETPIARKIRMLENRLDKARSEARDLSHALAAAL